ncbi:response regulator transcription factor [Leptolyngbya sp. FACHB-261]|uniref:response regulator transcription factor n=1 Tax=Leptolyngbya sp. FACHB-261 TaxID=2692806 RepID=UPI001689A03E|nr:response regulator transcription factor [Leptolyngbya sp. FACHB-261]MBD2104780.1 response regulator transcription factor [Leptolyngbya sp. FACHB-261]
MPETIGEPITLVVVDDHPDTLAGAAAHLSSQPDFAVIGQAMTVTDALELITTLKPQVALVDLELPRQRGQPPEYLAGITIAQAVQASKLPTHLVVMTGHRDRSGLVALQPFVQTSTSHPRVVYDYLLKSATPQERAEAVRQAAKGIGRSLEAQVPQLTPRERIVLIHMAQGLENSQISETLVVAESTVISHIKSVMSKVLGEPDEEERGSRRNRMLCVRRALEYGLIQPDHINQNWLDLPS